MLDSPIKERYPGWIALAGVFKVCTVQGFRESGTLRMVSAESTRRLKSDVKCSV